jgi:phosphate ABC transporter permease subunit PstA/phosphate ABC transporter permease protein PstC
MKKIFNRIKSKDSNEVNQFKLKFNLKEKTIFLLLFSAASAAIIFSIAILYSLAEGSISFFTNPIVNIFEFFTSTLWAPSAREPHFGLFLPLLSVTLLAAGGALLIATPLGIGSALYLSEFANKKVRSVIKPIIEVLAGIPSIVYGFFALMVISPFFQDTFATGYFNIISAIIVMSVMVLPIIVSISDDAMKAVPNHLRESSLALGATKWETSTKVVMPAASSGIIASILLGFARAIGETMVVLLVAGSIVKFTFNPFDEGMTMSSYIAKTLTGDIPPGVPQYTAAFVIGLALFLITYTINYIASRVVIRIKTGSTIKSKKDEKKKSSFIKKISKLIIKPLKKAFYKMKKKISKVTFKVKKPKELTLKTRYRKEKIGVILSISCLIFAIIFLMFLLSSIISRGIGSINLQFLTYFPSRTPSLAGIYPALMGSIYLMLLTLIFSAPLGIGAAIYLNEFAKDTKYTRFLRSIIQNLAGVPSIVFGLTGLIIFVRVFGFEKSLLAGSLTLTIMVLPIIIVATEEALKAVPKGFREAARGLGATKWQTVRHHVLPNAKPGILTGIILSLSRAIGETAPILFIAFTFIKYAPSGLMDQFTALPMIIFFWSTHPNETFHNHAAGAAIILLLILLAMNAVAIFIRQRAQARRDW